MRRQFGFFTQDGFDPLADPGMVFFDKFTVSPYP